MSDTSEAKPFWASKTLWANVVAVIAVFLGGDLLPAERQAEIVIGIMGIVNVALRLITKGPVTLRSGRASTWVIILIMPLFLAGCLTAQERAMLACQAANTAVAVAEKKLEQDPDNEGLQLRLIGYQSTAETACRIAANTIVEPPPAQ